MMKKFKELLDFLGSLTKAWPAVVVIIGLIATTILALARFGSTKVQVGSLPLFLILLLLVLAAYPILKLVQWLINRQFSKPFVYKGLVWKTSLFGTKPCCPKCFREVDCYQEASPQAIISRNPAEIQEYINRAGKYNYSYKCRIHGVLPEVPNLSINDLANEAKDELKWQRSNSGDQSGIQNR